VLPVNRARAAGCALAIANQGSENDVMERALTEQLPVPRWPTAPKILIWTSPAAVAEVRGPHKIGVIRVIEDHQALRAV
jgi:hypothetical protein